MQSQVVCRGCASVLLYPSGATNVCCALCSTVTYIPSPGMDMTQLICRGCRSLLMYPHGATSVRCSCCHAVNLAPGYNQVAHVNCGNCWTTLMYPNGSPSVKCPVCHYVTNVSMANMRVPLPANRPNGISGTTPSTSMTQTVVVENPMSVDESGKLVSNVVVGVTTEKKKPGETLKKLATYLGGNGPDPYHCCEEGYENSLCIFCLKYSHEQHLFKNHFEYTYCWRNLKCGCVHSEI